VIDAATGERPGRLSYCFAGGSTFALHGTRSSRTLRLAKRRESEHPIDAITVCDRDVEQHIDPRD
jgi:hypothetical protein